MMPGMTGFDVCQAVRADEAVSDTRILMLTAKGRETDVAKGSALGADAYVTKPFSTRELAERSSGRAPCRSGTRRIRRTAWVSMAYRIEPLLTPYSTPS